MNNETTQFPDLKAEIAAAIAASSQGQLTIKRIAVHPRPHLEEILALWLLRNFGKGRYPGIHCAKLEFWGSGQSTPDGRPVAQHEADGTLVLGIALAKLDDHRLRLQDPDVITCSAQLVANSLGIAEDPALGKILTYVSRQDSRGGAQPFDLAHLVRILHDRYPDDPREVIYWAFKAISAKYEEQVRFLGPSRQAWAQRASVRTLQFPDGTVLRVGSIVGDDPLFHRMARFYGKCDLFVQQGTPAAPNCGNTQIYVSQHLKVPGTVIGSLGRQVGRNHPSHQVVESISRMVSALHPERLQGVASSQDMPPVLRQFAEVLLRDRKRSDCWWATCAIARRLRMEEYRRAGAKPPDDTQRLTSTTVADRPEWHLTPQAGWIFNGSTTARGVPATRIPLPDIHREVRRALVPLEWRETLRVADAPAIVPSATPGGDAP
ncbi:MAG: hypothetical protein G01um101431_712 [Parcubacteria group bacterium Gr01-1014_31]|nr:MAG: hypothetical protein G01um101431_712 [Parcubacteria group bacterium Gr01-1014_31]